VAEIGLDFRRARRFREERLDCTVKYEATSSQFC
jgi:hypothetical protein